MTKREQVEAVLRAAGMVEEAPGDWVGNHISVYVYLDIAHSPQETAWYRALVGDQISTKEVITYDEVIQRFS